MEFIGIYGFEDGSLTNPEVDFINSYFGKLLDDQLEFFLFIRQGKQHSGFWSFERRWKQLHDFSLELLIRSLLDPEKISLCRLRSLNSKLIPHLNPEHFSQLLNKFRILFNDKLISNDLKLWTDKKLHSEKKQIKAVFRLRFSLIFSSGKHT